MDTNKGTRILSISILSSGREKTIERCLASLVPFKDSLGAQIVVVDTDPSHNSQVRAIVDKYADLVIPFTWCDDFAAARNAGLKECRGKWFLFIDDDEWIINASPIIEWLKSEYADEYEGADLGIANYTDENLSSFSPSYVSRLFRIDRGAKFKGMVHEYPEIDDGKIKLFNETIIGHSGYIYRNDDEKREHIGRNIELLRRQIELDPSEMRWKQQLINEYEQTGDLEKAITLCEDALEAFSKHSEVKESWIKGYFICERVRLEGLAHDYGAEKAVYERVATEREYGEVCNAYLDFEAVVLYFKTGDYGKASSYAKAYLQRHEKAVKDDVEKIRQQINFLEETFQEKTRLRIICTLIDSDIREGYWESFERYFDELNFEDGSGFDFSWFAEDCIVLASVMNHDLHMDHLFERFWGSGVIRPYIMKILGIAGKDKDEGYWRLVHALVSAVGNEPGAPYDLVLMLFEHEGRDQAHYTEAFQKILDNTNPFLYGKDIWEIIIRNVKGIEESIKESSLMKWRRNVDNAADGMDAAQRRYFLDFFKTLKVDGNAHLLYASFKFGIKDLAGSECEDHKMILSRLKNSFDCALSYYDGLFKDEKDYVDASILPEEYLLGKRLGQLFEEDESLSKDAAKAWEDMIGIMPEMDRVIGLLAGDSKK